jgi:hypothetical protein
LLSLSGGREHARGEIQANLDRFVRENINHTKISSDRQNLRVSVTRARDNVIILTPSNDPFILLPAALLT